MSKPQDPNYWKKYYEKNRERILLREKIRGAKNKEAKREYDKIRRNLHGDALREYDRERYYAYRRHSIHGMLRRCKSRAKRKGQEFSITADDIEIPEFCPVFKTRLIFHDKSGGCGDSPSLDRIDSSKGYIKGNVCVISMKANVAKGKLTFKEISMLYDWAKDLFDNGRIP